MDLTMSEEEFFFAALPSNGEAGPATEIDNSVSPATVIKPHCLIDVSPRSDIFEIDNWAIVTKSLGVALVNAECSGFCLREAQFEHGEALLAFRGTSVKLPDLVWCDVTGKPGADDFGFDRGIRLIISRRAKEIIEKGPHEGVIFVTGSKAPPDNEIMRLLFEDARKATKQD